MDEESSFDDLCPNFPILGLMIGAKLFMSEKLKQLSNELLPIKSYILNFNILDQSEDCLIILEQR